MSTLWRLRGSWLLQVATIVLVCFGNAFSQVSYKVTDLGALGNDNLGCAMSINNEGWTVIQDASMVPGQQDNAGGTILKARDAIGINGFQFDLGTLGGQNSWMNWGEINDFGQIVGYSETAVPDPNGEDICTFGTHLTCRPFLWQYFHMRALPTLGGNNGQASAINNRGQNVGFAENGVVDSTCSPGTTNNRIQLPVLWEKGKAHVLPTVDGDPDGDALWINDKGQAVGETGNCSGVIHAVVWTNGAAWPLPDFKTFALAYGNNNEGQIVGTVGSADSTTQTAALWQNDTVTSLGLLPGDFGGIATGINDKGQVVGSNWDSNFNWSHAFIWQNNVMTDLNALFPASSNLFATMANKINERGQISGMALVLSGPDAGNIHAFLATPVNQSIDRSMADVARTLPKVTLPANVGDQFLPRFGPGRFGR